MIIIIFFFLTKIFIIVRWTCRTCTTQNNRKIKCAPTVFRTKETLPSVAKKSSEAITNQRKRKLSFSLSFFHSLSKLSKQSKNSPLLNWTGGQLTTNLFFASLELRCSLILFICYLLLFDLFVLLPIFFCQIDSSRKYKHTRHARRHTHTHALSARQSNCGRASGHRRVTASSSLFSLLAEWIIYNMSFLSTPSVMH